MTKDEYLESQRGVPFSQIIANQPTVQTIGTVRGADLNDVVTVYAAGLKHRLDAAADSTTRTALLTAYDNLTLEGFGLNFAVPEVMGMLLLGVQEGLVTADERDKLLGLATYNKPEHNITLQDCVAYFGLGDWAELDIASSRTLMLVLHAALPESAPVRVEMRESHNGEVWSAWERVGQFKDVRDAGIYYMNLPNNGLRRQIRWRGAVYAVNGTVEAV